jgi:hypothetical protein
MLNAASGEEAYGENETGGWPGRVLKLNQCVMQQ